MRIGIDIDGVLVDLVKFVADYGSKFCYENKIQYTVKKDEYNEAEALGITNEQAEKFWNTYLTFYAQKYPARDFAAEVIKKLKQNHEIYIITARNEEGLPKETYGKMQDMVKRWLLDNKIEYDKLIFTEENKLTTCIENKIDTMIDDAPHNVKEISTRIPVLCFDNPYNVSLEGNNITRVYSWYDILNKIEKKQ